MTTGEKISKLRKEKNLTQEQLADLLNVSRQSISKWEQDLSFPETEKLIQLSKIFETTIDYLLNQEKEEFVENKVVVKKAEYNYSLLIYSVIYLVVMIILYAVPYLRIPYSSGFGFGNTYVNASVYSLIAHGPSDLGNIIVILASISMIFAVTIGIVNSLTNKIKNQFRIRKILSIIEFVLFALMLIIFNKNGAFGLYFIPLVCLVNIILVFKLKQIND